MSGASAIPGFQFSASRKDSHCYCKAALAKLKLNFTDKVGPLSIVNSVVKLHET